MAESYLNPKVVVKVEKDADVSVRPPMRPPNPEPPRTYNVGPGSGAAANATNTAPPAYILELHGLICELRAELQHLRNIITNRWERGEIPVQRVVPMHVQQPGRPNMSSNAQVRVEPNLPTIIYTGGIHHHTYIHGRYQGPVVFRGRGRQ